MMTAPAPPASPKLRLYSTCPESVDGTGPAYQARIVEASRWSEDAGFTGILIYTDNRLVDPWQVAQVIVRNTRTLVPLVAVQPAYTHPYTVAKLVATIAHLFGRQVAINWVAGGFKGDLEALNEFIAHDERYDRLREYAQIVSSLVASDSSGSAISFQGKYYSVTNLRLSPTVSPMLQPITFVSGSSAQGRETAAALQAVAVHYPDEPATHTPNSVDSTSSAVRIGLIARATSDEAWQVAEARFPLDRRGQVTHKLAMKSSDSEWHKTLSDKAKSQSDRSLYWLRPFENYHTFCPYLVGDFECVTDALVTYMKAGYFTYILDIPADVNDLQTAAHVFANARLKLSS